MEIVPPVPKPRLEHRPGAEPGERAVKKPVPLPRNKLVKQEDVSENANSAGQSVHSEPSESSETSNIYENSEEMESIKKPSSKGDSKFDLESIQEKAKAVIRSTWTASTKRSFRNKGSKHLTVQDSPSNDEVDHANKFTRSQSLPTSDIFQSISFISPLVRDQFADEPLVDSDCDGVDSDDSPPGPPPPVYPPPPLPDESVYDEVQSVASANSGGPNVNITERVYEDIAMVRTSSNITSNCSLEKSLPRDNQKLRLASPVVASQKNTSRADSWSFYDIPCDDLYQNVASIENSDCFDDTDSLMVDGRTVSDNSSISPSLQEFEALTFASSDETSEDRSNSSSRCEMPQSQSIINEAYENWGKTSNSPVPVIPPRLEEKKRYAISKSVILEFDPFYPSTKSQNSATKTGSSELMLLTGSGATENKSPLYGKIKRINKIETSTEECPPVPPRRFDSLTTIAKSSASSELPSVESESNEASSRSSPTRMVDDDPPLQEKQESVSQISEKNRKLPLRLASLRRKFMGDTPILKKVQTADSKTSSSSTFYETRADELRAVERPVVPVNKALKHIGELYKSGSATEKAKDFLQRRCVITEGKLTVFSDKSGTNIVDIIPLDKVISIQLLLEPKTGTDAEMLYFFELNMLTKIHTYTFGATGLTERRIWMQKILESIAREFPMRISTEYTRAGWCFLKEGISGIWNPAWLLVQKRTLFYYVQDGPLQEADLRKARCIVLQDSNKESTNLGVSEKGKLILVDFPGQALYLQMDSVKETEAWQNVIRTAALDNGFHLAQQQLTRDEIPTIVDKCINFVYAHGSMSEGIYRRSGANSSVTRLLTQFREDAWAVQLTRQEYTEYDVSSVLKRFFRELPEPLLTTELHSQLCEIAAGKMGSDRLTHYRHVLEQLPPINYLTARKLIGHLHIIHLQREKNLMPVENLAAIWGPTLMHVEVDNPANTRFTFKNILFVLEGENSNWSKTEGMVVSDLILMYPQIFGLDADELSKEKKMLEVLELYHAGISNAPQNKPSGDLKMWIHLESKDSGNCVNVTIGPQKTAGEVCKELAGKMMLPAHELCLEEVVLTGGTLSRPLHHTERVLDTVLRWGYWDEADRKDNCLVLCKNELFKEAATHTKRPLTLCGDLRFADQKSKSFKGYLFEFSQAKLCYYKDKKGSVKLGEWKIEDIVWYVGHERKRNPQMRWAVTFIERHNKRNRSRDYPYFGYTIAGTSKEEQMRWISTMLIGEYPQGLLPSPSLLE